MMVDLQNMHNKFVKNAVIISDWFENIKTFNHNMKHWRSALSQNIKTLSLKTTNSQSVFMNKSYEKVSEVLIRIINQTKKNII